MKVTRLHLKNIRCFEELTLDLNGKSALLVGDNGDGKSTVLRSLAMGLCDEASASAFFRDLYGEFVRKGEAQGVIKVDLEDPVGSFLKRYRTKTKIHSRTQFEDVEQKLFRIGEERKPNKISQDQFPWDQVFATGYGPGIRVHGTKDYDDYFAGDALYPLFVYDETLQNPELAIRRLVAPRGEEHDSVWALESLKDLLRRILQLEDKDGFDLTKSGISVQLRGSKQPLSASGDGYHSTVTWVLDLLSWWYLYEPDNLTDIHGIVLIDEIEQHLHPRWQRNIMQLLQKSFPHVQFIATTHSPLVASGCEDIPVHSLKDGKSEEVHPFGWRAEEVYSMMGLSTSRAESFRLNMKEYQDLDDKRLRGHQFSPEEEEKFSRLRKQMNAMPGTDPVRLVTELENLARLAKESAQRRD